MSNDSGGGNDNSSSSNWSYSNDSMAAECHAEKCYSYDRDTSSSSSFDRSGANDDRPSYSSNSNWNNSNDVAYRETLSQNCNSKYGHTFDPHSKSECANYDRTNSDQFKGSNDDRPSYSSSSSSQAFLSSTNQLNELNKTQKASINSIAKTCTPAPVPEKPTVLENIANAYGQQAKAYTSAIDMNNKAILATGKAVANTTISTVNAVLDGGKDNINMRMMESKATNQVIKDNYDNIITGASLGVDVASKNPSGIVQTLVTEVIAKENDKFNQRGVTEKNIDTALGTIALGAGLVAITSPEPVSKITSSAVATGAGCLLTAKECLKMANDVDNKIYKNTLAEHRPITNGLLSEGF